MLNCVYHPIDEMRVVDDVEKERLIATGVWFDHPLKAKALREKYEMEEMGKKDNRPKPKPKKAKGQPEDAA
jgi:hypothetical protein